MKPFNRAFTEQVLEDTVRCILIDYKKENYAGLMDTSKWLDLVLQHTDNTLADYERGVDVCKAPIVEGTEEHRSEVLHFNSKRERVLKAIQVCDKYKPFG